MWGIDASTAMLDRLRAKPGGDAIRVAVGDMADVDLSGAPGAPDRFAVVLIAFNTFFNLVDEGAQQRCLERCAALLSSGGTLVIEASVPEPAAAGTVISLRSVEDDHVVLTVTRTSAGARGGDGVVRGEHLEVGAGGVHARRWLIRLVAPEEIDAMAAAAGLRLTARWATWDEEPFEEGAPAHISLYVAR